MAKFCFIMVAAVVTVLALTEKQATVQAQKIPFVTGVIGDPDAKTIEEYLAKYYIGCSALRHFMQTICVPEKPNPVRIVEEKMPFNGSIFGKRTSVTNGRDPYSKIFAIDLSSPRNGRQVLCCKACDKM